MRILTITFAFVLTAALSAQVSFGDTTGLSIKRDDPERRKSFRARHKCDQKKDKTTPGYWSCKFWEKGKSVTDLMKG